MRKKLLIASLSLASAVMAQKVKVEGTVLGQDSLPLVGVDVLLEGKALSTTSDADGKYLIETDITVAINELMGQESDFNLNHSQINWTLTEPSAVKVTLINMSGQSQSVYESQNAQGEFSVNWLEQAKNHFRMGPLLLKIQLNSEVKVYQFVLGMGEATLSTPSFNKTLSRALAPAANIDSLSLSKSGYVSLGQGISSYETLVPDLYMTAISSSVWVPSSQALSSVAASSVALSSSEALSSSVELSSVALSSSEAVSSSAQLSSSSANNVCDGKPDFVGGTTNPVSGEEYVYSNALWLAKNDPGVWESPAEGWFWTKISDCGVTLSSSVALSSSNLVLSSSLAPSSSVAASSQALSSVAASSQAQSSIALSSSVVPSSSVVSSSNSNDPGGYITQTNGGYTLQVHPDRNVASLKISTAEFNEWNNNGFYTSATRNGISSKMYDFFEDDFDVIFFVSNNSAKPSTVGYTASLINVSNNVTGTGSSVYNTGASAGSAGKLKSYIHMTKLQSMKTGPTLHEMAHMWANFVLDGVEYPDPSGGVARDARPHWGWTGTPGQLGGFDESTLKSLGGNLYQANSGKLGAASFDGYANGGNSLPYSALEMYLAGFWPKDSVKSFTKFTGVTTTASNYGQGKFYATGSETVTIDDIIADKGVRNPSYLTSQKDYRILCVVLTTSDLSATDWSNINSDVKWFSQTSSDGNSNLYNFWEATRGLGTVKADGLYESLKNP